MIRNLFKGNLDLQAWRRFFFEASEGTMQMDFSILENYINETDYQTVGLPRKQG